MHLLVIGGSDAGIEAGRRAREFEPAAAALFHGMRVDELNDLDLSYTPPFGSPWNAVQHGAQSWVRVAVGDGG
jgi:hypothetical protein